ncbi:myo-inosose-2 dehydratase [Adhaeribacter aerolatus]|uniref:Myo-inosose-2 dehydratase n=1 Tax=Adhaeribacter aerolatus TaxID=670289 RepID=A0A512AZK9_9BACT|nr:sugar phosphate isomerase/epimerase [Adhaeribacter aerolatus]GEO05134.1 myo-inosose-2 dehydratase [Adhaeribacter aerolatus]
MSTEISRRTFLAQLGLTALSLPVLTGFQAGGTGRISVPGLKLGYSAITWGGNDVQAIKDIAALGFKGVQLRSNVLKEYSAKPAELKAVLTQYKLELPMFSSGNANINTGDDEKVIQTHLDNAKFVKALGGRNIQITNSSRPKDGAAPTTEDLQKYGRLLNEIGRRSRDMGVITNYHNHMHQLGETPEEVDIILSSCDPQNVKLELDTAHYHQGGGDPVAAIKKYQSRLNALHLKDVRPKTGDSNPKAYTFVELGQGNVNLPGVFKALADVKFKGWGIVELDSVPDKAKTPAQCAEITRSYLNTLGFKVQS